DETAAALGVTREAGPGQTRAAACWSVRRAVQTQGRTGTDPEGLPVCNPRYTPGPRYFDRQRDGRGDPSSRADPGGVLRHRGHRRSARDLRAYPRPPKSHAEGPWSAHHTV